MYTEYNKVYNSLSQAIENMEEEDKKNFKKFLILGQKGDNKLEGKYVIVEGIDLEDAIVNYREKISGTIIGYANSLIEAQVLGKRVNCPIWIFNLEEDFRGKEKENISLDDYQEGLKEVLKNLLDYLENSHSYTLYIDTNAKQGIPFSSLEEAKEYGENLGQHYYIIDDQTKKLVYETPGKRV